MQLAVGQQLTITVSAKPELDEGKAEKTPKQKVDAFVRNVTLGQWNEVSTFLAAMEPDDADKVYSKMLLDLAASGPVVPEGIPPEMVSQIQAQMQQSGQVPPSSFLTPDDILQIIEMSPKPIRLTTASNKSGGLDFGDGISGKWEGQIDILGESEPMTMQIVHSDGNLTGTMDDDDGDSTPIESGTYNQESGAFSMVMQIPDPPVKISASGTVSDGKMTASLSIEGITVSMTATLVEAATSTPVASEQETKAPANSTAIAANINLPPGVSIDALPPEIQAQIRSQQQTGDSSNQGSTAKHIAALAQLIQSSSEAGHDYSQFVATVETGTTHLGSEDPVKRLTAADLFMKAGLTQYVQQFLPSLEEEATQQNLNALKIWSKLALAKYAEKRVASWLETAWSVNQSIVAMEDATPGDKDAALSNLIQLTPQVEKEVGVAWMNDSFTELPERGMTILTNLGTKSATMASQSAMTSEAERLKLLRLQNEAVENLIRVSPEVADRWQQALTLLAKTWLTEAQTSIEHSREGGGRTFMQIDMYGNYYWQDEQQFMQRYNSRPRPRPIKLGDMLQVAPSLDWRNKISSSLHTEIRKVMANLHLRVNEEDKAFPYIEQIATGHPEIARDLIHEFLRIWTRNHDPNTDKRQRNPYIYMYGFDQKADAIPLTRSKQERNLVELTAWVDRIRKLNLEDVDETLLANAFTSCHSSAEVFDLDRVRAVFGELGDLKPETVAALCQKMRGNLGSSWRDIREQEAKQTNRREPEVQQEVLRGYSVAIELAAEAITAYPESWQPHLALACLMYDANAYSQRVQKTAEFSDRRDQAFVQFAEAAQKYERVVTTLEKSEQQTDVYDFWFYAGMGACDLNKITDKTVPDLRQYKKIREALTRLPGAMAEVHMSKFANNLFTRMSTIKPEIKFRYLRGGFEVVGDHPRAWEARNLYDYYKDLVSEIKLEVKIDGDDNVGHDQPFGAYVNIVHTSEIERESGGFGKYVQNQNNMANAFNYGRPTEDYRDKFTDAVNQALGEHFEIISVTFQSPDTMQSRPTPKEGWRVTPYAYVLMKPNGAEIDRVAPLKLDLDFLDTSGYVVVPIESPAIVIDASMKKGTQRPVADLQVTQTVDERQADEGKLIVEVSASGNGLIPELEEIINLERENFEVVNINDQGVLPSSFNEDSDEIQIVSDRSWTVEYKAKTDSNDLENFSFGDLKMSEASMIFQRYEDADLVSVEQTIALEKSYEEFSWTFLYWLLPLIVIGLVAGAFGIHLMSQPQEQAASRFAVPEDVNPFTVLTLLKDIKQRNGISSEKATELQSSIHLVEEQYFSKSDSDQKELGEDLSELARKWVDLAK